MPDDFHYLMGLAQRLGLRYEVLEETDQALAFTLDLRDGTHLRVDCVPGSGEVTTLARAT